MPVNKEAEAVAQEILKSYWTDRVLPIDPAGIAKKLGLAVFAAQLEPDLAGALVKQPGRDPVIILNERDGKQRQRFTCGHEIGHFVRRSQGDNDEFSYQDDRNKLASSGSDPIERFCNGFAAALLMPADAIKELRDKGYGESDLANAMDVSLEAMRNRLDNLGYR